MFAIAVIAITLAFGRSLGPLALPIIGGGIASWIIKKGTLIDSRSRRLLFRSAIPGIAILGSGWIWAYSVTRFLQWREGYTAIGNASRGAYYEYWGCTMPAAISGVCYIAYFVGLAVFFSYRRRFDFLLALIGYTCILSFFYIVFYVLLSFDAYD
jgi:hypothetical protein